MPSYVTPKRATAYVFYVSLEDKANPGYFKASPTLAAGDVIVATDDGVPGNITTLPVFDADFTKRVKVSLSATEMTGDNVTVIFSDAAVAEWFDLTVNLQTTARQIDDLASTVDLASTNGTVDDIYDDLGDVRTVVDSILLDTGTDGVVLADDAITAAKIAANAIGSSELAASAASEIAAAVLAGGAGTYSYSNTVDDGSGNLIDGAYVELSTNSAMTNIVNATHTNSLGAFTVYSDTAGTHYLRITIGGYEVGTATVTLA